MESKEYTELVDLLEEWHENVISELCADDDLTCDDLCGCGCTDDCIVIQTINAITDLQSRLSRYEQAEKDGRLLIAPEKLYEIIHDECSVDKSYIAEYDSEGVFVKFAGDYISPIEIGKTVFLTREEAAAALKERENDG